MDFKATSDDYKTLKLKSKKYNMVKRYQEYINDGEYFEAQKRIGQKAKEQIDIPVQDNKTQTSNNSPRSSNSFSPVLVMLFFVIVASASYILVLRRRK